MDIHKIIHIKISNFKFLKKKTPLKISIFENLVKVENLSFLKV